MSGRHSDGVNLGNTTLQGNLVHSQQHVRLPMTWYNFLIYFQLFFAAVVSIFCAVGMFSNIDLRVATIASVLRHRFALRIFEIVCAVAYCGMAVLCIIARQKLANYKKGADKYYCTVCVIGALLTAIDCIRLGLNIRLIEFVDHGSSVTGVLMDVFVFSWSHMFTVVGMTMFFYLRVLMLAVSIVATALNFIYFKKRAHLFVN